MLFRCYCCRKIKVKNSEVYEIVLRGVNRGVPYERIKFLCSKCGDSVDERYQYNKRLAELEADDE